MYFVYILKCKNASFYIGCTQNIKARIIKHNKGYVDYTKPLLPVKLICCIMFANKYKAFDWIDKNTEPGTTIFILEGSYQGEGYYTQRNAFTVTLEELQEKIDDLIATRSITIDFHSGYSNAARWSLYRYRTGYFSFEQYEPLPTDVEIQNFEYVIMSNLNEPIAVYNQAMADLLVNEFDFAPVYQRDGYIILRKPTGI